MLVTPYRPEVRFKGNFAGGIALEQDINKVRVSNFALFLIGTSVLIGINVAIALFGLPWLALLLIIPPAWITGTALAKHRDAKRPRTLLDRNMRVLKWENSRAQTKYVDNFAYNQALQDLMDDVFGPDETDLNEWDKVFDKLNNKMEELEKNRREEKKKNNELPDYVGMIDTYEGLLNENINRIDGVTKVSGDSGKGT